jgi:hypothetical protein
MDSEIDTLDIINYVGCAFYLGLGLVCIFSSTLVMYICLTKCDRKAAEIILTVVFCAMESISTVNFIVFAVFKLAYGYKVNEIDTNICKFSAIALNIFSKISLVNVSVLATLRYLIVCHKKEYKLWIWLIVLFLPNAGILIFYSLGFYTNDAAPSPSYLFCSFFTKKSGLSAVMLYFITFFYIVPCWITTYCYFMVGWTANKRLNSMRNDAINNSDEELLVAIKNQRFNLWIQILFVFFIYNANFVLAYATWVMKIVSNYRRPPVVDTVVALQTTSTAYLNPIITIIFQPDINHEFKFLWIKLKAKIKKLY